MWRVDHALVRLGFVAFASACARTSTQPVSPSPQPVPAEQLAQQQLTQQQLTQQQLAIESDLRQQQRVDDVGDALLTAATPFCGTALAPHTGVRFANVYSFPRGDQDAARSLGFTDTLVIVGVASGSTAARSGFSVGDRVVALDGGPPPSGPNAASLLASAFAARPALPPRLTLEQGGTRFLGEVLARDTAVASGVARVGGQLRAAMPADTACAFNLVAARGDALDASTDGVNVTVTSAMLRVVADDDELAAVLAHGIAHNAMRHVQGSNPDSAVFSQDSEREADSVAMYVLARAGRPTAKVATLWRRMAQQRPGGSTYASSHPTTDERFVRLEQMAGEIQQKIARGEDLRPDARSAPPAYGIAITQSPARSAAAKTAAAKRAAPRTSTVLVDRSQQTTALQVPKYEPPPTLIASAGDVAPISTTTIWKSDSISYTFGPPVPRNGLSIAQVRRHAREAFDDGREAVELRIYDRAENRFREAVLYDGSDARYHAALGAILLKRGKPVEAEAVLTAAVLLDVENAEYRRLLLEARKRD